MTLFDRLTACGFDPFAAEYLCDLYLTSGDVAGLTGFVEFCEGRRQ